MRNILIVATCAIFVFCVLNSMNKYEGISNDEDPEDKDPEDKETEDKTETKADAKKNGVQPIKFDTIDDLRDRLNETEFIEYMSEYYPLMYKRYVRTRGLNRVMTLILILISAVYVVSIVLIRFYYKNKPFCAKDMIKDAGDKAISEYKKKKRKGWKSREDEKEREREKRRQRRQRRQRSDESE